MLDLNVAVVGCGSWGRNHARVYNELDNANLVAVADLDASRAKEIGAYYNVDWNSDPDSIFKDLRIDAVSICTPTITHAELGLRERAPRDMIASQCTLPDAQSP